MRIYIYMPVIWFLYGSDGRKYCVLDGTSQSIWNDNAQIACVCVCVCLGLCWCGMRTFGVQKLRCASKKKKYEEYLRRYTGLIFFFGWTNEWWWLMRFRTVISHLFVFWPFSFFYIKWVVNFMTLDVRHLKYNKMILVGNYACWLRLRVWCLVLVNRVCVASIAIILFTSMTYLTAYTIHHLHKLVEFYLVGSLHYHHSTKAINFWPVIHGRTI